jgi:RNA polymerase sigma factor (sigma-70 family)
VDRWNPEIGGRFSTYAVYWIRASVLRCIAERDDMLRVPVHVTQSVKNIEKAARRIGIDLANDSWREANAAKQLAEEAGLSAKNFEEAMNVRMRRLGGGYTSFESWMQMGKDMASDVSTLDTKEEEQGMSKMEVDQLKSALSKYLRPKEMEAISWRYGLVKSTSNESRKQKANRYLAEMEEELFCQTPASPQKMVTKGKWGEAMSFNEVGKHMKVSAEYGRRLCHAALKKLQQAAKEGKLEPALLM